ncbi:MAG TPA: maleylacetoacetate isomerase [Hyphomicrobiales bacterium]|nr:maleylacetoacetate isomerase [Hyphomicrobiales bacterium]
MTRLYTYFRSTAAYRVRIALNFKGIAHELVPVHLVRNGGEHRGADYLSRNPQGRVPALGVDSADGETVLAQSLAILEYLEEIHPEPALLPVDPVARAKVRGVADIIACDIHPLNNLAVLGYLKTQLGADQAAVDRWYAHWITVNFIAIEQMIEGPDFCFCGVPTLADLCLVPQVFNARRFKVPIDAFPKIVAIDAHCSRLAAFADAHPDNQPDAE